MNEQQFAEIAKTPENFTPTGFMPAGVFLCVNLQW